MASIAQPQSDIGPFPAEAQIALALVVLKSKPAEASVEDYLSQLRARNLKRSIAYPGSTSKRLDGTWYRRNASENTEEEKATSLGKLCELKKQRATPALGSSPAAQSPLNRDGKRRQEDTPAAKANSRSKRRASLLKVLPSPAKDIASTAGDKPVPAPADEVPGDATKLLQTFFALRMQLKSQLLDCSSILVLARRFCHDVFKTLDRIGANIKLDDEGSERQAGVWTALRRTYPTVLEAMDLLYTQLQAAGGVLALISDLAKILAGLLKCLQYLATGAKPRRVGLRTRSQSQGGDDQIWELTSLITSMMTDLDLTKAAHRELSDGLLCTFFEHLGASLSLAVFSNPMLQATPQPQGLLQPRGLSAGSTDQTEIDLPATLKVATYLIAVLRKLKPRLHELDNLERGASAGAFISKVQQTLLKGVFGDQEQAFSEALKRPAETDFVDDTEDLIASNEEDMTSESFIGEIWNNVGWDILTKYIN